MNAGRFRRHSFFCRIRISNSANASKSLGLPAAVFKWIKSERDTTGKVDPAKVIGCELGKIFS